jgi:hypothetical protein
MAKCGPIRSHSTETSERRWRGSEAERNLGDAGESTLRKAYAWVDCDGDPSTKSAYKFIHHEVSKGGEVGAANVRAAVSGIAVLNGGRGGADVPEEDRKGIYKHLASHLSDAGKDPAPLK